MLQEAAGRRGPRLRRTWEAGRGKITALRRRDVALRPRSQDPKLSRQKASFSLDTFESNTQSGKCARVEEDKTVPEF